MTQEQQWSIQSLADNGVIARFNTDTFYILASTPDGLTLQAYRDNIITEEISLIYSKSDKTVTILVDNNDKTSELRILIGEGHISLSYFLDNSLAFEGTEAFVSSAISRKYGKEPNLFPKMPYSELFFQKINESHAFNNTILRAISRRPFPIAPVDFCGWACSKCWNGEYVPHSCVACIFCNITAPFPD